VATYADALDEERRALFFLALVEGMPITDVADILASNANTVYSRVRVMRRELALLLKTSGLEGDSRGPA
jgi:DNA-directed RNA polymerase specialized sigma24 family protein